MSAELSDICGLGLDMYEIRKHKIELRRKYLARRAALAPEERAAMDERICRNILASAAYRYADILLLFYPVKGEVDVLPIARAARAAGKRDCISEVPGGGPFDDVPFRRFRGGFGGRHVSSQRTEGGASRIRPLGPGFRKCSLHRACRGI